MKENELFYNMKSAKVGVDPIEYREIQRENVDDLVYLCRVIAVVNSEDYIEFVFMKDKINFISVRYSGDRVEAAAWVNENNPYSLLIDSLSDVRDGEND